MNGFCHWCGTELKHLAYEIMKGDPESGGLALRVCPDHVRHRVLPNMHKALTRATAHAGDADMTGTPA